MEALGVGQQRNGGQKPVEEGDVQIPNGGHETEQVVHEEDGEQSQGDPVYDLGVLVVQNGNHLLQTIVDTSEEFEDFVEHPPSAEGVQLHGSKGHCVHQQLNVVGEVGDNVLGQVALQEAKNDADPVENDDQEGDDPGQVRDSHVATFRGFIKRENAQELVKGHKGLGELVEWTWGSSQHLEARG